AIDLPREEAWQLIVNSKAIRIVFTVRVANIQTEMRSWFWSDRTLDPDIGPVQVNSIHRVGKHVVIQVSIAAVKLNRILGSPPPRLRVVVPSSKAHELCIRVVESSS